MVRGRAREAGTLAAALVLHGAVIFTAARWPAKQPVDALPAPPPESVIDLSPDEVPLPAPPAQAIARNEDRNEATEPSSAPQPSALAAEARSSSHPATHAAPEHAAPESEHAPPQASEPSSPVAPPSPAAPSSDLSAPPPPPSDGARGLPPGLGGAPVWSLPGVLHDPTPSKAAPSEAPAARVVPRDVATRVIAGTLRKRDQDLGIDAPAGGVVASTLADVVRSSAVPADARATFEVRLGANGDVEGVRLVSATAGDAGTWDRVVKSAKGALQGRSYKLDGRAGATVTVKVESKVQYPGGTKERILTEPVCANEVIDLIEDALKNPSGIGSQIPAGGAGRGAALGAAAPPPEGVYWDEQRKKFCIPVGIRGRVDPSNIGAHAINVVKSSFTVKRDGERTLPADDVLPVDTRVPWALPNPTLAKPLPPKPKKKKKPGS